MEKRVVSAAVTGSRNTKNVSPHIPMTPEEIAQSCIECWRVGASIVHIHVRDPKTRLGTQDYDFYDPLMFQPQPGFSNRGSAHSQ